ncbi:serine/threonine protein phosphatase, partial [Bifidobacterium animalis]|nr:serine/threonine protein phosphatase [Bifidobacterium animalis]
PETLNGEDADESADASASDSAAMYPSAAPGTFALPVMDVDCTRNVLGLVLVNSGDYAHGGGFGSPSPETLAFLKALPERIGA